MPTTVQANPEVQSFTFTRPRDRATNFKGNFAFSLSLFPQQGNPGSGLYGPLKLTHLQSLYSSGKTKAIGFCVEQFQETLQDQSQG